MGPAPAPDVSSVAWVPLAVSLPPLEEKVTLTGRLSGLEASQEMVARSPIRTTAGDTVQAICGMLAREVSPVGTESGVKTACVRDAGLTGCTSGAELTSITSTPSPTW